MIYLDMVTKYYDKREPYNKRKYYNTPDELFIAKGRIEYVGKYIQPSWMDSKNIEVTMEILNNKKGKVNDMSKMRVWHMPQVGCNATLYVPVETAEEGKKVMDILAAYDLFQLENRIKPDFCNINGLQMFNEEDQEWEDWFLETEDDYYDDVDSYFIDDKKMEEFEEELYGQLKG